jgi:hypothetical protein
MEEDLEEIIKDWLVDVLILADLVEISNIDTEKGGDGEEKGGDGEDLNDTEVEQ